MRLHVRVWQHLMAGSSRSVLDTAVTQIHQLHARAGDDIVAVDATLRSFRDAVRTLPGSTPPDLSRVPEAARPDPRLGSAVREVLLADPLEAARAYHGPALVLAAARDVQVETTDADRLLEALGSAPESKRRTVIAEANHVFKREDRDPTQLSPGDVAAGYAAAGTRGRDDGIVAAHGDEAWPTWQSARCFSEERVRRGFRASDLRELAELHLELRQPGVQTHLGLHHDLQLAVRQPPHAARMRRLQRDDHRLARDAEPVENLEDALDDGQRDGGELRHRVSRRP
jgi:hypothetical protein